MMSKRSKLVWVGTLLIVLGFTLAVTSYFNVYSEETKKIKQQVLLTKENSSSDLNFFFPVHASRALVWVIGSSELQGVLNSTLNYSSSIGRPITMTLSDGTRNISASVGPVAVFGDYWLPQPVYASWFSIPSDWSYVSKVSISNSESHPVCWIATCIFYEQVIHLDWLGVMFLGVASILIGAAIVSVIAVSKKNSVSLNVAGEH
jgi:hypothetical protein